MSSHAKHKERNSDFMFLEFTFSMKIIAGWGIERETSAAFLSTKKDINNMYNKINYICRHLLTYLLHGAESFLRN